MAQRLIVFDINSLAKLLTHYTEGAVPLGAEVEGFEASPTLQRYVSLVMRSQEWVDDAPVLHVRYEAGRVMKLNDPQAPPEWTPEGQVEAPRRQ